MPYFRLSALSILLLFAIVFTSSATAQEFDPCPRLADADPTDESTVRMIWDWFSPKEADAETTAYSDHTYFFTMRPGRFVNVRCDDQQFEEQEMYPLGIMVKPIAYVPLPDFEAARDDRAILVITEYGQRKLVKEKDIAPILHNEVYLFADTPINAGICRSADDCPGNSLELCELRVKCRYVVSARYGYAIAAADNPTVRAAMAAYQLIRDAPQQPEWLIDDEQFKRMQKLDDVACQPFPVKAYKPGGVLHQPRNSHFSLCSERRARDVDENALLALKPVTMNTARAAFAWQLDGSFHRRFGVPASGDSTTLLQAITDYRITSVKECEVEQTTVSNFVISGGLKAKVSAGILEFSGGVDSAVNTQITQSLSKDDYLLMSTYFITPIPNAPGVSQEDESDLWFFRVLFRSKCEDRTPSSATSIIIHYHRLEGRVLEVSADDLRQSYVNAWSEYGYAQDNSASALREGHFWIIPDLAGYFIWRDTLRKFIEVENNVTSRLLDKHPKAQRAHVRDFFVHLMLAAAFNNYDPSNRG